MTARMTAMTNPSPTQKSATTQPTPAGQEDLPDEADRAKAPRLDRPGSSRQQKEAASYLWDQAKEKTNSAMSSLGNALRSVQDTDPAAVGRKTSQAVERASSETTNFLKTVVTTSVSFGAGVAVGLARGGPSGLSDKQLERLRMRDGSGSLTEVARQTEVLEYTEDGITKRGVAIEFLPGHQDLAEPIRAEDSSMPEGQAFIPLELAYEVQVKTEARAIESYSVPLTGEAEEGRETYGFLVMDRAEGSAEVYAYNDA